MHLLLGVIQYFKRQNITYQFCLRRHSIFVHYTTSAYFPSFIIYFYLRWRRNEEVNFHFYNLMWIYYYCSILILSLRITQHFLTWLAKFSMLTGFIQKKIYDWLGYLIRSKKNFHHCNTYKFCFHFFARKGKIDHSKC